MTIEHMKTILVPTDFSRSAETALYLAIPIAKAQKAKIVLTYIIAPPVPSGPYFYGNVAEDIKTIRRDAIGRLRALAGKIDYAGGIEYELIAGFGGTVEQITTLAQQHKAGLIIMGISQKTGFERFVFGTTALGVIRNSPCPVLAAPEDLRVAKPMKKITFATDYAESDRSYLRTMAALAASLDAELSLMHISTEEYMPESEVRIFNDYVQEVSGELNYPRLSAELLTGDNVETRLLEYLGSGKTDVLGLSTRDRGFF